MKKLFAASVALACATPLAAHQNPRAQVDATVAGKSVAVEYGRPSLKGRDMLGRAEVGMTWRMGADAATTLTTEADLSFGDVAVPAGSYRLQARKVAADKWHLEFVGEDKQTVAEVPLTSKAATSPVEMFTIDLSGEEGDGTFTMAWGETLLSAAFSAK